MFPYSQLPDWKGATVVILGGGPSLQDHHFSYLEAKRHEFKTLATNRAYRRAPWADLLHCCDNWFWSNHRKSQVVDGVTYPPAHLFAGVKTTAQSMPTEIPPDLVIQLPMVPRPSRPFQDPARPIHFGWDTMYQAEQLAVVLGAVRLILLGLDGKDNGNWHEGYGHRKTTNWERMNTTRRYLADVFMHKEVEVWNCSEGSAIRAYPLGKLEDLV